MRRHGIGYRLRQVLSLLIILSQFTPGIEAVRIYAQSTDGRLLLGLKGQLSELELHTIQSRMTAGLLNKAHRGD